MPLGEYVSNYDMYTLLGRRKSYATFAPKMLPIRLLRFLVLLYIQQRFRYMHETEIPAKKQNPHTPKHTDMHTAHSPPHKNKTVKNPATVRHDPKPTFDYFAAVKERHNKRFIPNSFSNKVLKRNTHTSPSEARHPGQRT